MPVTKPAGCTLQLLGTLPTVAGVFIVIGGLSAGSLSATVTGVVVLCVGLALLKVGRPKVA